MSYTEGSKRWKLSKEELIKIAKGFGIALAGSALALISSQVIPELQTMDLSPTGLLLVSLLSTLVNALMKLVSDTR